MWQMISEEIWNYFFLLFVEETQFWKVIRWTCGWSYSCRKITLLLLVLTTWRLPTDMRATLTNEKFKWTLAKVVPQSNYTFTVSSDGNHTQLWCRRSQQVRRVSLSRFIFREWLFNGNIRTSNVIECAACSRLARWMSETLKKKVEYVRPSCRARVYEIKLTLWNHFIWFLNISWTRVWWKHQSCCASRMWNIKTDGHSSSIKESSVNKHHWVNIYSVFQ